MSNLPIDPAGIVYDEVTRDPIAGTTLTVINVDANQPLPDKCLLAGQQGQVTSSDGTYRLNLLTGADPLCPEGNTLYRVQFEGPGDYAISTLIPAEADAIDVDVCPDDADPSTPACEVQPQIMPPTGNDDTTYYLSFEFALSGERAVIRNHIPMGVPAVESANILLSKSSNKSQVTVGDVVSYTLTAENQGGDVTAAFVNDTLPPGFSYAQDSARLKRAGPDGTLGTSDDVVEPIGASGVTTIQFGPFDLAATEVVDISYVLRVSTGVTPGEYVNTAVPVDNNGGSIGNQTSATVVVTSDPLFNQTTIIGKVFHDRDGDGYQDSANATKVEVKSDYFGWNSLNLGTITARSSIDDSLDGHQAVVRMPYVKGGNNSFRVTTREGTIIDVDNSGKVTYSEKGEKKRGMSAQDLRVSVKRGYGVPTASPLAGKSIRSKTDVLEITLTNYGVYEEGLPGVRLATVEGWVIETDAYGRYHIPAIEDGKMFAWGRNFIVKVDPVTIPQGAVFTTENPRVLRISVASLNKFNFGVKLPERKGVRVKLGSVFFDTDSASIRADQWKSIDAIVTKLREIRSGRILIEGNADPRGNSSYNKRLAEKRAETVRRVLRERLGGDLMTNVRVDIDWKKAQASTRGDSNRQPAAPQRQAPDPAPQKREPASDDPMDRFDFGGTVGDSLKALAAYILNLVAGPALAGDVADLVEPSFSMEVISYGDERPVSGDTSSAAGLQEDRRVDVLVGGGTSVINLPGGGKIWATQDPASIDPRLDISGGGSVVVDGGQVSKPVNFSLSTNYNSYIDRWELSIFRKGQPSRPLKVIRGESLDLNQQIEWDGSLDGNEGLRVGDELEYVFRAYDDAGHVDETLPRELDVLDPIQDQAAPDEVTDYWTKESEQAKVFGETNLRIQSIPVRGARVRFYGHDVPEGTSITIDGQEAALDSERKFVMEKMLPTGQYDFNVEVADERETRNENLSLDLTDEYFFMVGIADVTVGEQDVSGSPDLVAADEHHYSGDVFVDGRLAFYLKSKYKGKYLITAQMDTHEDDIGEIFNDLHKRDPKSVFRRLDPDLYYPTYGDGSTLIDDTDSMGRFYVRVEWDQSRAVWGNYNTSFTGTELAQFNRSLYGAQLDYRSPEVTRYGEHRSMVNAFGSEAQSLFRHNQFLGTGGSLYYLKDKDIVVGSEKVWIEVRQRGSERVVDNLVLQAGRDYEIDDLQGRIILTRPLMQIAADTSGPSIVPSTGSATGLALVAPMSKRTAAGRTMNSRVSMSRCRLPREPT
ncbi:MAG: OmpA family protein [Gammaproteobacteria bacterium]